MGSTRSTIRRRPPLCRTRNGEEATTERPSSAAARSSLIRWSVDRASASSSSAGSTSPSTITSPAARSRSATLWTTRAACSRGLRSGAAGTTVAATSATAPPISASVHRFTAAPGSGTRVATTIDCTAACIMNSCPPSSRIAVVMASADDDGQLPPARPDGGHDEVGQEHPDGHPDGHLGHPAEALPIGRAEADHGRDRGEERRGVPDDVGRDVPGHPRRDRALGHLPALGPQPVQARAHRRTPPAPEPVERLRGHAPDRAIERGAGELDRTETREEVEEGRRRPSLRGMRDPSRNPA